MNKYANIEMENMTLFRPKEYVFPSIVYKIISDRYWLILSSWNIENLHIRNIMTLIYNIKNKKWEVAINENI